MEILMPELDALDTGDAAVEFVFQHVQMRAARARRRPDCSHTR